jgi:hypothetical protein
LNPCDAVPKGDCEVAAPALNRAVISFDSLTVAVADGVFEGVAVHEGVCDNVGDGERDRVRDGVFDGDGFAVAVRVRGGWPKSSRE